MKKNQLPKVHDAASFLNAARASARKAKLDGAYSLSDALAAPPGTHPELEQFLEQMEIAERQARFVLSLDERTAKNGVVALVRHLKNAEADPAVAQSAAGAELVRLFLAMLEQRSPLAAYDDVCGDFVKVGASIVGQMNGMKPHVNHRKAAAKLPDLWNEMKSEGKTKTDAAPLIAARLGLAVSTVRRKLQGM